MGRSSSFSSTSFSYLFLIHNFLSSPLETCQFFWVCPEVSLGAHQYDGGLGAVTVDLWDPLLLHIAQTGLAGHREADQEDVLGRVNLSCVSLNILFTVSGYEAARRRSYSSRPSLSWRPMLIGLPSTLKVFQLKEIYSYFSTHCHNVHVAGSTVIVFGCEWTNGPSSRSVAYQERGLPHGFISHHNTLRGTGLKSYTHFLLPYLDGLPFIPFIPFHGVLRTLRTNVPSNETRKLHSEPSWPNYLPYQLMTLVYGDS